MNPEAEPNEDSRIEEILKLIAQLEAGNLEARGTLSKRDDGIDRIITGLNRLAKEMTDWHIGRNRTEQRLNDFLGTIIALASLDFSNKASVGEAGDIFDALATGLNALGEELHTSVVSRAYLNNIITSMILDTDGLEFL